MASYNSRDGIWTPSKERVVLYDKNGDPHIYEGLDRSAVSYMKEQGVDHLGVHFKENPEIIERAHDRKVSVDEYCKTNIHTDEKRNAQADLNEKVIVNHKLPERTSIKGKIPTGGTNTAGDQGHLEGGFGSSDEAFADAMGSAKK